MRGILLLTQDRGLQKADPFSIADPLAVPSLRESAGGLPRQSDKTEVSKDSFAPIQLMHCS